MNNKKGFTLFEILTIVTIIAVIGVTSIISFNKIIKNSNIEKYNNIKAQVIEAATVYIETDVEKMHSLNSGESIYITIGELQESSLLSWNLKNPLTKPKYPLRILFGFI